MFVGIVIVGLGVVCGLLLVANGLQWLRQALAEEQIVYIQRCRDNALALEPAEAAEHLRYILDYYPSGTKQREGSVLDRLVESQRKRAVADVIAHLRRKTGEDLGDRPEPWIEKYTKDGAAR